MKISREALGKLKCSGKVGAFAFLKMVWAPLCDKKLHGCMTKCRFGLPFEFDFFHAKF